MNIIIRKKNIIEKLLNENSELNLREKIVIGNSKIMFSCPHSVIHFRNGVLKYDEPDTLVIANYIHKLYNTPFIYKIISDDEDANFDIKSNYKDILCDYIKKNNITLLIDLHQMKSSRKEMICIGTNSFKNVKNIKIVNSFVRSFSKNNIGLISIDEPFSASGKERVTTHVHRITNINCLQIELNSKLFKDDNNYTNVLKSFKEIYSCICNETK